LLANRGKMGAQKGDRQVMTATIRRVGIIGLGKMGFPMARHLRKAGFDVAACDVSAAACQQAAGAGVRIVASPKAVAAETDFVIVIVGFDSQAETAVLGPDGIAAAARPGLIVGIASTVAPRTMQKLAGKLSGSGMVLLDMPLTRGEGAAEAGKMLTMVGGDVAAFEACKPALATFASSIYHVGELGAGQVGKMVNNLILWACISANHEGFGLARKQLGDAEPDRGAADAMGREGHADRALRSRPAADQLAALRSRHRGGQEREVRARLADAAGRRVTALPSFRVRAQKARSRAS
jgi:hypothetical protein